MHKQEEEETNPRKVDTPDDRINAKRYLDKLAKDLITGEYQRTLEDIQNYNPENGNDIITLLQNAKGHLIDLEGIDRQKQLSITPCDLSLTIPPREWLIKDWLPARCVSMITGEGGVGKSYATLQLCAMLTCGVKDDFLFKATKNDNDVTEDNVRGSHSVVYAAWEDEPDECLRRLQRIANTLKWVDKEQVNRRLHFVDMKGHGPIWGPEFSVHIATRANLLTPGVQLTRICEDKGASLLILDPGAGAFGGNENDRAAVREYTSFLSAWGQENKCATLILAHPPKSNETYSGSTDWLGSVRSMWSIQLVTETENKGKPDEQTHKFYTIEHEKSNYALRKGTRFMVRDSDTGVWLQANNKEEAIINSKGEDNARSTEDSQLV